MTRRRFGGTLALSLAAVGLAGWVGTGEVLWVLLAAPATVAALVLDGRNDPVRAVAGGALLLGVLSVLVAEFQLDRLARSWPERAERWEEAIQDRLAEELDALLQGGEEVVRELVGRWEGGAAGDRPELPAGVRPPGVAALGVFGPGGELLAWEGTHQGPVPPEVRTGASRYLYHEGALFGYLYVTEALPDGGGTAMAAALLRSDLPPLLAPGSDDFDRRFEARTGARIEITRADRALGESVWDLRWEDRSLFSVMLHPASEAEARAALELRWMRIVVLLLLAGWLLGVRGARGRPVEAALGGGTLLLVLLLLPLGRISGWARLPSPADFLLPGPLPLLFGDLLALGAAGILSMGLLPRERIPRLPPALVAPAGVLLAGAGLLLLDRGASAGFLAGETFGWVALQGTATALVLLAFGLAALLGVERDPGRSRLLHLGVGMGVAGLLALGWAGMAGRTPEVSRWLALCWILPTWLTLRSLPSGRTWGAAVTRWAVLSALASTLAIPWAWSMRVEARIAQAEEQVDRLGTRADPFLEFLLLRAAEQAASLAEADRDPVEILYGAWTGSGMAGEGLPLWITYWSAGGIPQEELRIGVADSRPVIPAELIVDARDGGQIAIRRFDLADAHYMAVAPLPLGAAISVVVPPRRALGGASPLGPLFSPARGMDDPLVLVPLLPGEIPGATDGVVWIAAEDGWQGETYLAYPDEVYHAHYLVEMPGWVLLLARGTLLLLLNLAVLTAVWATGRWMGEGLRPGGRGWRGWIRSFRARVTLALFAFFLVPTLAFGALAYQTLAQAAIRTAEALAERAAEDAATWYAEVEGAMDMLARRVGSDLLLYENGELVSGSLPELVRLGLYEGWLPPGLHRDLVSGEELMTTAMSSLGGWDYVVAYRRIPGGRVLAAPAPLEAGATALRQRDVADLIGFAVLLGGILSVLLSLRVGRALTRPIQTLQVASERVGAGNMKVHLPERRSDEFGAVFGAFNRMVDRLAQTRRALLRTSRRTRAIVEEVATGVVALNRQARVTLANPKAEELLGVPIEAGAPLPEGDDPDEPRTALARWVAAYFRDGLREAATEFSFGDRRIRVRARRVSRRGPLGGAVLSLEDVTDELRTERILAWGEMAQQVAHEVKNPLTPIKLGVQHIRRAWEGGEEDFGQVLDRNVTAILREIDRLASVASSFSRFAAPSPSGAEPLEEVDPEAVISDVLDLYRAGGGPVRFGFVGGDGVEKVRAREGELKEVLVNLLENARAALPEGGSVTVELEGVGEVVELRVRDDGTGIPEALLPRIFEPHFSTRSTGTGLGLAIVRRLVESWGGSVAVQSREGGGTVITLRLRTGRDDGAEVASGG